MGLRIKVSNLPVFVDLHLYISIFASFVKIHLFYLVDLPGIEPGKYDFGDQQLT